MLFVYWGNLVSSKLTQQLSQNLLSNANRVNTAYLHFEDLHNATAISLHYKPFLCFCFSSLGSFKLTAFCVEKSVLRQGASAVLKRWRFPSAVFSEMSGLLCKTLNLWPLVFLQHMQHLHRLFYLHPAIMKALEHILCVICWYFVFYFFACHFMQCIGLGMDLNFDSQSNFINIR